MPTRTEPKISCRNFLSYILKVTMKLGEDYKHRESRQFVKHQFHHARERAGDGATNSLTTFKVLLSTIIQNSTHRMSLLVDNIHIYIIGHYNPSVRISTQLLASLMLCALILYVSGETYSLTATDYLRNFFMAGLFTLKFFTGNLLRGSRRRNIFHISFLMTDLGY